MESEADFRKEEIKKILGRLNDCLYSVQQQQDSTGRGLSDREVERAITAFQSQYSRAQEELQAYGASFRSGLTPQAKKKHVQHKNKFKEELSKLRSEMKMARQSFQVKALKRGGVKPNDINISVCGDKLLQATKRTVNEQEEIARRMLNNINDTKQVGEAVLTTLGEQTEQMEKIADKARGIRSDIKNSLKLVNRYRRRIMTDRLIWIFVFLIFATLVGIIIYATVSPEGCVVEQSLRIIKRAPSTTLTCFHLIMSSHILTITPAESKS